MNKKPPNPNEDLDLSFLHFICLDLFHKTLEAWKASGYLHGQKMNRIQRSSLCPRLSTFLSFGVKWAELDPSSSDHVFSVKTHHPVNLRVLTFALSPILCSRTPLQQDT